jgi:predicted DNA-binding transcriptional regulator AlpA
MNDTLWTIANVAAYLVVSDASAERMVNAEGFPAPVILPSVGRGERKLKRWIPADVIAWVESRRKPRGSGNRSAAASTSATPSAMPFGGRYGKRRAWWA